MAIKELDFSIGISLNWFSVKQTTLEWRTLLSWTLNYIHWDVLPPCVILLTSVLQCSAFIDLFTSSTSGVLMWTGSWHDNLQEVENIIKWNCWNGAIFQLFHFSEVVSEIKKYSCKHNVDVRIWYVRAIFDEQLILI